MKYINVFEDEAAYNEVKDSLEKPQLAYINETGGIFNLSAIQGPSVEMVDLGLSVKWAACNIGATCGDTVESWYGNYYAWGEIETKTEFYGKPAGKYKHGIIDYDEEIYQLTKYNTKSTYGTVDNKTVLESEDDIASIEQSLRMPTQAEFVELCDTTKVTNAWVTDYNEISGLNGRLFTSNINSNTLFIPAAGYFDGSERYNAGSIGYVWSSSLFPIDPNCAYSLSFYSDGIDPDYGNIRYSGLSVRGVQ